MMRKLSALLLLFGTFCAAQTDSAGTLGPAIPCPSGPGPVSAAAAAACYPSPGSMQPEPNPAPAAVGPAEPVSGADLRAPSPSRIVGPLTTRSEFEIFAEDAAGRRLPVYGRQLFDQVPSTFAPADHVPVPANYVIGPGDELLIRVWGKINFDTRATVDRNGQIFLPRVATLTVAGLHADEIAGYLRSAIGNLYKDFELNVTLGQLRSIQIFVLGSARQPGAYTVSSLSTLVDALFASGGPSATGSMRNIQLRRGNRVVTDFDIYDLLRNGDKSHDAQLLPGDVIYIPPSGPQVAIMGSVNEPGIYELKGGTTIASAITNAGGVTNLAEADRVLLERIADHRRRLVDDFALDASGLKRMLKDGDLLQVFPISPRFENSVMLRGSVAQPGRYPWHEGMRISDLIPSRDFLITRRYWKGENHLARAADEDEVQIPQGSAPPDGTRGAGAPALQNRLPRPASGAQSSAPGNADQGPQSDLQSGAYRPPLPPPPLDLMADLAQNSAEINWEYAAIERLDQQDLSTRLIAFNLGNAISNPASADNQTLRPGDVVTIFSRRDLPLPVDKSATFVRVAGEVNAPGVYRVAPGESLQSVVARAGGLTSHSNLYAAQLTRESTRLAQEQQLRISLAQMQRELTSRYAATPSVPGANPAEQQMQLSAQQAAIAELASIRPTGRIVLGMKPNANSVADIPAIPLEDGDSFYVPPLLNTVQVSGAVYNENAFRYQPRERLSAYLAAAGGPTRQADTRRIFLIRADGTVVSSQSRGSFWHEKFGNLTLLPGDAIVVPTKLKSPGGFLQQLPFLTQMLSQTALTGAVLGTTY
jgi:protein involved in polysaccharide export with SLBB domain